MYSDDGDDETIGYPRELLLALVAENRHLQSASRDRRLHSWETCCRRTLWLNNFAERWVPPGGSRTPLSQVPGRHGQGAGGPREHERQTAGRLAHEPLGTRGTAATPACLARSSSPRMATSAPRPSRWPWATRRPPCSAASPR